LEEETLHINLNAPFHKVDTQDFEGLFKTHYVELCTFAQVILKDPFAAEDIVQEVFIKLWAKRKELEFSASIKTYLFTATKNSCLNHLNKYKRRSELLNIYLAGIEQYAENVDAHICYQDLQQKMTEVINTLPPRCREVFVLSRSHAKSYKEIGEQLDISVKTVEQQISKALKQLRISLKGYLLLVIIMGWVG